MGYTYSFVLVLFGSILATTMANRPWPWGYNNYTAGSGSGQNNYTAGSGWGWGNNNYTAGSGWGSGWGFNNSTRPTGNCTNESNHNYTTGWGAPYRHNVTDRSPRKIIVGGSEHWHFGFNYSDWAIKNGPFYINDVLVFKFDAPSNNTFPHSVYLLPNLRSYSKCDLKRGRMIANPTQGENDGFEITLKKWKPYFFACGEHDGIHCKIGMMKFSVMPTFRPWF